MCRLNGSGLGTAIYLANFDKRSFCLIGQNSIRSAVYAAAIGKDVMMSEVRFVGTLSLRHILEDGLAILENSDIDNDRRKYVLAKLSEMFGEAKRGSKLATAERLFVSSADRNDFERYSFLDKYLSHDGNGEWEKQLGELLKTINGLKNQKSVSAENVAAAKALLARFLSNVSREAKMDVPPVPEEIKLSR